MAGSAILKAAVCGLVVLAAVMGASGAPQAIYDDALRNDWQDWSWATHDMGATAFVHAGSASISFVPRAWEGLYFHRDGGASGATYDALEFWVNGGAGAGQNLRVVVVLGGTTLANEPLSRFLPGGPRAGQWDPVRVPFDDIGVGTQAFDGIYVQDGSGGSQATVYLDDLQLAERSGGGGDPPATVAVRVDPAADRRAISALIYGVNHGEAVPPGQPRYTVRRWGGNATTRYNWKNNVSNRGMDWFFMNVALAADESADAFLDGARAAGAQPLLTVPLIGWTPIGTDTEKRWGFSIAKYGPQTDNECNASGWPSWCEADAGNGVRATPPGGNVTGNDPRDTSVAIGPAWVTEWMAHIAGRLGTAGQGGLRLYDLDNEPMLWNSTHRDVHPDPVDYAEIWQKTRDTARAMKIQDPAIETLGPVVWGWCAYFYSAADGCGPGADHAAHGDFLEWYLAQVEAYRQANGVRLVDWLDVHYYPQAGGVALSDDETPDVAARRLRSVKSLYDASYVDESWIGQPVRLIPRMREIIARRAPGTKLAITEYNWGGDDGLTSALAQVEVLGLFGREGVDLATRWVAPAVGSRVEDAFRVYLDYDGAGATIEGQSVRATSADVDQVGAYAVHRADGRLYVVLVNKATAARTVALGIAGGIGGETRLFGFHGASRLAPQGTIAPAPGAIPIEMPARSAYLAVVQLVPAGVDPIADVRVTKGAGSLRLTWTDVPGVTGYVVLEDTRPDGAFATETGTATSGTDGLTVPMPAGNRFYRVVPR